MKKDDRKQINAAKKRKSKGWSRYFPSVARPDLGVLGNSQTIGAEPFCVFPFISLQRKGKKKYYKCEGTGFFIHHTGLFVTAKHVPIYDEQVLKSFIAIHAHGIYVSVRHVKIFWINKNSDIAVGFLDEKDARNKMVYQRGMDYNHLIPNYSESQVGQVVKNFGYGGSKIEDYNKNYNYAEFNKQWHEGPIIGIYPEGRGSWNKTGPEIEGVYGTIGLASGGPVFNETGELIGVNSKSMPKSIDGSPPISVFTPISEILEIKIEHPIDGEIKIKDLK